MPDPVKKKTEMIVSVFLYRDGRDVRHGSQNTARSELVRAARGNEGRTFTARCPARLC
jgi:hypothetical protein